MPMTSPCSPARVDASISRAEAALGRFVLDEDVKTQRQHLLQPVAARRAADQPARAPAARPTPTSAQRVAELQQLYQTARRGIRARRARDASPSRALAAPAISTQAAQSDTGPDSAQARRNRQRRARRRCAQRMEQTQFFAAEADRLTDYLSWLGVIVGLGAIFLGSVAVQALRQNAVARRAGRKRRPSAREALEEAVAERTQRTVGSERGAQGRSGRARRPPKPSFARSRRWRRSAS